MKILITGIQGFVGSNLVVNLKGHHMLYGLDITSTQKEGVLNMFIWNELDIIPTVDLIIHLAGKAHDTNNTTSSQEYFDINVGLTQKIFAHFLKSSATKFIFISSVKAVADSVRGFQLTEETLPNPKTPYGKSKLEAEKYIISQPLPVEKKIYILRPCMIHGPGNKGNLNLLYKFVQKKIPWPLGAFENKRSFTSIDNLTYIITQIAEKEIEPGIYQIADDETLSTNELIRLIALAQNRKPVIWKIPKKLICSLAKLGDILHLPLNNERLTKLTESYPVSNLKIKKTLKIEKLPITAEDGFSKTFESFKN